MLRSRAMAGFDQLDIASHAVVVSAPQAAVWEKLVNWKDWPTWDTGMESVVFNGPIAAGLVGQLKFRNGPTVALRVCDFNMGQSYASEFSLLGTRFIFDHALTPADDGGIKVTFTVNAKGPTAMLIGNLMKPIIRINLPKWMGNFEHGINRPAEARPE